MIVNSLLPDTILENRPVSRKDWQSITNIQEPLLVHHRAQEEASISHPGPLSIKAVLRGSEYFDLNGVHYEVRPDNYLVVNQGQEYASHIASPEPVDTFTLFFPHGMAEDVLTRLVTPDDQLLDNPHHSPGLPVTFFERLYPLDDQVQPQLHRMKRLSYTREVSIGWQEEQSRFLLERLLAVHRNVRNEVLQLPAVKHSTRIELYRRLHRAKDFMYSAVQQPLRLEQIANVACLSPHHFLRTFKLVFGQTPHQYLAECRIDRARQLLETTERSITDICFDTGFQSLGTFSWSFRARYGQSPSEYRKAHVTHFPDFQ